MREKFNFIIKNEARKLILAHKINLIHLSFHFSATG